MKYYLNRKTETIHVVADIPKPRGNGFIQCGQFAVIALLKLNSQQVAHMKRIGKFKLCGRCKQLAGI